jgi:hypothetical protein
MRGAVLLAQATGDEPAGGAAAAEAIGATVGALVVTAVIALVVAGHRSGRVRFLARLASVAERQTGLPGWAALPSAVMGISLLIAALGMYWDISLHIDNGRDDGPLANPAHYLILVGLYGSLLAGALSMALAGRERPCPTAVHLGGDWWAPVGGLMIAACGAFALTGFPLDDLWHRIFGQDVTLWGPTHLMLIGGGSLATLGGMVLMSEAITTVGRDPERERGRPFVFHLRRGLLVGGFLVALSTFQGEFDFGVPQFRLVLHPILIMLAAGVGLVAARIYLGRGGALLAVLGFVLIRGFIAIMVGGVWGQTTPTFPLYVVEALLVEAVFLRSGGRSPVATGALAGVLIGTVGLAAEWGWSHVWVHIPWTTALLPEALIAGLVTAVAGGAVGGFIGGALTGAGSAPATAFGAGPARPAGRLAARLTAVDKRAALLGAVVLAAVLAWNVPLSDTGPRSATVSLRDVEPGPQRTVAATIRIEPPGAVGDNPEFLNVTAWQGRASVLDPLERTAPGEYRTTEPIPVHGGWKATLRLQQGSSLVAVPIFQPEDRAIPAPETPASARFTRDFRPDIAVLQRERKLDVAGALSAVAYLTVLATALALLALLAWSLLRIDAGGPGRTRGGRTASSRAELV